MACAYSTFPVISEVHLTTLTCIYEDHNLCEDGCNVAYKYFKGVGMSKLGIALMLIRLANGRGSLVLQGGSGRLDAGSAL
jgi:hypothetical protein